MIGQIGKGAEIALAWLVIACIIFVPLGIWKLCDIIIWCYNHLEFTIK